MSETLWSTSLNEGIGVVGYGIILLAATFPLMCLGYIRAWREGVVDDLQAKQSHPALVIIGILGILLFWFMLIPTAWDTLKMFSNEPGSISAPLMQKEVERNRGTYSYYVTFQTNRSYRFDVPENVYAAMEIGDCFRITFAQGDYLAEAFRVERLAPTSCASHSG